LSIFIDFFCYVADGGEWGEEMRDPRACSAGTDGGMTHAARVGGVSLEAKSRGGVRASEATRPTTHQLGTFWPKNNRNNAP
jgi:hypothetical protein